MGRIDIGQVNLRVRGIPSDVAQQALQGLGPALQSKLGTTPKARSVRIDRIEAGKLTSNSPGSVEQLRHQVAQAISSAIHGNGRGGGQTGKPS